MHCISTPTCAGKIGKTVVAQAIQQNIPCKLMVATEEHYHLEEPEHVGREYKFDIRAAQPSNNSDLYAIDMNPIYGSA